MIYDEWQKEYIEHDGNCLLCTGRQVGKTVCTSHKVSNYVLKHAKSTVIVVSLTEDQAKLIVAMCLNYLEEHSQQHIHCRRDK